MLTRKYRLGKFRRTLALEPEFWTALDDVAARSNASLASIIEDVDRRRADANLASALRVFIVEHFRERSKIAGERQPARIAFATLKLASSAPAPSAVAAADQYRLRAKRYRDKAEEARQLADSAQSEGMRKTYLGIAESYQTTAEQMEALAAGTKPGATRTA